MVFSLIGIGIPTKQFFSWFILNLYVINLIYCKLIFTKIYHVTYTCAHWRIIQVRLTTWCCFSSKTFKDVCMGRTFWSDGLGFVDLLFIYSLWTKHGKSLVFGHDIWDFRPFISIFSSISWYAHSLLAPYHHKFMGYETISHCNGLPLCIYILRPGYLIFDYMWN